MSDEDAEHHRKVWPSPLSVAGVGEGHTHDVIPRYKLIFTLLMVVIVALALAVATMWWRVLLSGAYRDEQLRQIRDEIRQSQCELLDQLPEGGLLERPRERYGCGPGIPLEELPPELRERYAPSVVPLPGPTGVLPDDRMGGAVPDPYRAPANTPGG